MMDSWDLGLSKIINWNEIVLTNQIYSTLWSSTFINFS